MGKIINAKSQLFICVDPTNNTDDSTYKEVCSATQFQFNTTLKKQDSTYFCNGGETTSTIVGRTQTASVSIDFDESDEAHLYLYKLLTGNFASANNQYIKVKLPLREGQTTPDTYEGKCCLEFKSGIPSGAADELVKIEFDIHPQDKGFKFTQGA